MLITLLMGYFFSASSNAALNASSAIPVIFVFKKSNEIL
jgi:hypothetical protein